MTRWITCANCFWLAAFLAGCQASEPSETPQIEGPTGRVSGVVLFAGRYIPSPTIVRMVRLPGPHGIGFYELDATPVHYA
jgi:hypothetical protein